MYKININGITETVSGEFNIDIPIEPTETERIEALELALLSMVLGGDNNV